MVHPYPEAQDPLFKHTAAGARLQGLVGRSLPRGILRRRPGLGGGGTGLLTADTLLPEQRAVAARLAGDRNSETRTIILDTLSC